MERSSSSTGKNVPKSPNPRRSLSSGPSASQLETATWSPTSCRESNHPTNIRVSVPFYLGKKPLCWLLCIWLLIASLKLLSFPRFDDSDGVRQKSVAQLVSRDSGRSLPLLPRNGEGGTQYCDCNLGNYNNQLVTCKVCVAVAYAMNRRLVLLPWCEQTDMSYANNGVCNGVDELFSIETLRKLVPVSVLPPPINGSLYRVTADVICEKNGGWQTLLPAFANFSLDDIAAFGHASFGQVVCIHPGWLHDYGNVNDICNGRVKFGMQIEPRLFEEIGAYFAPAPRILRIASSVQQQLGGPYLAMHLRRSQSWIPSEMTGWASTIPDTQVSMDHILQIARFELVRRPELGGRVFIATNSRDGAELALLTSSTGLNIVRFVPTVEDRLSPIEAVAVDIALLSGSDFFIGTPGSTFPENVRHQLVRRGLPSNLRLFCQYRAELPHLWPQCQPETLPLPHLEGIVLAVSFSFAWYENVPLLRWMYKVFPTVYFCGPTGENDVPNDVHQMDVNAGWFQHRCLIAAMRAHPGKRGYFGSNDDLILHWWNLDRWDPSRVMVEPCLRWLNITKPGLVRNDRTPTDVIIDGLGDVYPVGKAALMKAYLKTSQRYRDQLSKYTGGPDIYCEGDPDFVYIPGSIALEFLDIVRPFDEAGVGFLYIYHSVLRGIVSDGEIVNPRGVWMWGGARESWATLYPLAANNSILVHPMKLSSTAQRAAVVMAFEQHIKHLPLRPAAPPTAACPVADPIL